MSLFQELNHVSDDPAIASIEECRRFTGIASTTRAANAVDIVIDVGRKIIVDNVLYVGYVESYKLFISK